MITAKQLDKANRIIIIGSPGSGKTSLAKKLAQQYQFPNCSVDDFYWQPGWKRPKDNSWLNALESYMTSNSRWIIDGNYAGYLPMRLQHADLVIYLDVSPAICVYRFIKRAILRYLEKNDKTIPVKLDFQPRLLYKILFFRQMIRPNMLRMINHYNVETIILSKYT